jgi:hypothetical protein
VASGSATQRRAASAATPARNKSGGQRRNARFAQFAAASQAVDLARRFDHAQPVEHRRTVERMRSVQSGGDGASVVGGNVIQVEAEPSMPQAARRQQIAQAGDGGGQFERRWTGEASGPRRPSRIGHRGGRQVAVRQRAHIGGLDPRRMRAQIGDRRGGAKRVCRGVGQHRPHRQRRVGRNDGEPGPGAAKQPGDALSSPGGVLKALRFGDDQRIEPSGFQQASGADTVEEWTFGKAQADLRAGKCSTRRARSA